MIKRATTNLTIRDEIHGDMLFDETLKAVIDHPYLQRLRDIKQLGLGEFVFPCATHTRFQHSLGASYLAGQYFRHFLQGWLESPLSGELRLGETTLFVEKTKNLVDEVSTHKRSKQFWRKVIKLAALLHDVGHGPFSHTFETLPLELDFSKAIDQLDSQERAYFSSTQHSPSDWRHEAISALYAFVIFTELANQTGDISWRDFVLPVAGLIRGSGSMTTGDAGQAFERDMESTLTRAEIHGGVAFYRLLRPLISGPFDVDRIDYIQRDGVNCGVNIGAIEWRRLVSKVGPCLAHHPNHEGVPEDVVLVSNLKNQHVLDDFVFSLFQMYTQVYLHPKVVGLEQVIRQELSANNVRLSKKFTIDFESHSKLTDQSFRKLLDSWLDTQAISNLMMRRPGFRFEATCSPENSPIEKDLRREGYENVDIQDRPMLKDNYGIFLYGYLPQHNDLKINHIFIHSWQDVSAVAKQFREITYRPRIWVKLRG